GGGVANSGCRVGSAFLTLFLRVVFHYGGCRD
ncbi:hypothetical protein CCACVL1_00108, partial [Corchorus capsularis]